MRRCGNSVGGGKDFGGVNPLADAVRFHSICVNQQRLLISNLDSVAYLQLAYVTNFRAYRHLEGSSADAPQRHSARCHVNADNRRVGSDQGSYACRVRPNGGHLRRALSEYGTREGCRGENDQENSTCRRKVADRRRIRMLR